jgi:hypothetical protein
MANDEEMKEPSLLDNLKIVLKARNLDTFEDAFLNIEINRAIAEINRCRRFTPTDNVLYDPKYEYLIIPMCVYSLAKIGAEGQIIHTENGISRSYGTSGDYPTDLLKQIVPLIK